MIFSDRFEGINMIKDILQSCIFIGASLIVNGHEQGTITAADVEQADSYLVRVSGTSWLMLRGWSCGVDSDGPYVVLSASVDYLVPPAGDETQTVIELESTAPTDLCGDDKSIYCPGVTHD